jgi:uncharacterized repeat protein (TIGR01451 family)
VFTHAAPSCCCYLQVASAQSAPDISITKVVNDAAVLVGDDVIFTIQVKHNVGLQDTLAQNVVVTDTLPAGLRPYTDSWIVTPSVGDKGELAPHRHSSGGTCSTNVHGVAYCAGCSNETITM